MVTSSCAAIYSDAIDCENAPNGILTENDWNTTASLDYLPYSYSKTLAEKEAWKIAGSQKQWDLVVINPCGVFGPALNPKTSTSESTSIMKQIGDGTMKAGVPNLGFGVVDVRDLAVAHFEAGFRPDANGRNIILAHNTNLLEMALTLQEDFGSKFPIPKSALPKWLLMIVGPLANKAFTRKFIRNNVNVAWKGDNSKSMRELGMKYRSLKETMVDDFRSLVAAQIIQSK